MKLLITGARGQVGTELVNEANKRGYDVSAFGSKDLDITNADQVNKIVYQVKPDVLINAAAYTAVDKAEIEKELAYAINATGSEYLALICKKLDIPFLHISTDYVFDGEKKTPYCETDEPNPTGVYGVSKLEGEKNIQKIWDKHIILRVSWVFGEHGNNFVKTMLRLAKQRDELSIVDDQFGAPTAATAIACTLLDVVESPSSNQQDCSWGVYHLQSDPGVTWYEFAQEIFQQAERSGKIKKTIKCNPITSSEFPTPVTRPLNSKLDGLKLKQNFGIDTVYWKNDLSKVLGSMH